MKTKLHTLTLVIILPFVASICNAQAGTLDSSFGVDGKVTTTFGLNSVEPYNITLQKDGKILIIGTYYTSPTASDFLVARFLTNGNPDSSFGTNGRVVTHFNVGLGEAYGTAIIVQNDDKIIAGGYLYETYLQPDHYALARYLPNGNLDSTFGINGEVTTYLPGEDELYGLQVQQDGKIIAGGYCDGFCVIRYNPNGSVDSSFGSNGVIIRYGGEVVYDIQLQTDGKSIITGRNMAIYNGENAPSYSSFETCRLLMNGVLDSTFGNNGFALTNFYGGFDEAYSSKILDEGSIISAGYTTSDTITGSFGALVKYTDTGIPDSSFGINGRLTTKFGQAWSIIEKILVEFDGKIIITGQLSSGNEIVARFKSNGVIDSSFGINGQATINFGTGTSNYSGALQTDGKILALASPAFSIARLEGNLAITTSFKKNISVTEGNSGTTAAQFKIVLNQPSTSDVKVNYITVDGTAKAGSDYIATSGTATIKAGKTSKSIVVNVIGDNVQEKNEKFSLVLSNPQNAILGTPDTAICTIKNDDPGLMLSSSSNDNITAQQKIKLYPNPASDIITLEGLNVQSMISVVNASGETVLRTTSDNRSYSINIRHLSAGTYFIRIQFQNKEETIKFIKQ